MSVSVRNPVTGRSASSIIDKPKPVVASRVSGAASWGKWKPKRGKQLTAGQIPDALAAHDRAQEVSDLIRLTLGPWTSAGELPDWRRVPENQSVSEWRRRVKDEFDRAGIELPDKGSQEVRLIQAQAAEKGSRG